jgi:hypothetical protein
METKRKGRISELVEVNGRQLNTLFDSSAIRSYISRKSAEEVGLKIEKLKNVFEAGLGGRVRRIDEWCFVQGNIKDNPFHLISWVVEELGQDEKGREIELLFGATDMQVWNIHIDLEKEKLDLSDLERSLLNTHRNLCSSAASRIQCKGRRGDGVLQNYRKVPRMRHHL